MIDMAEEERRYYESDAKRKWQKENTTLIGVKLQHKGDSDIVKYMEQQKTIDPNFSMASAFKEALREKIAREKTGE